MMLPRLWRFKFKEICSSNYASQTANLNLRNVPPPFSYNLPQTSSRLVKRSSTYAILKNAPNSDVWKPVVRDGRESLRVGLFRLLVVLQG